MPSAISTVSSVAGDACTAVGSTKVAANAAPKLALNSAPPPLSNPLLKSEASMPKEVCEGGSKLKVSAAGACPSGSASNEASNALASALKVWLSASVGEDLTLGATTERSSASYEPPVTSASSCSAWCSPTSLMLLSNEYLAILPDPEELRPPRELSGLASPRSSSDQFGQRSNLGVVP